jgi:hypothetical protein
MGIKVGDRIKDNDPRMAHRVLTITAVGVVGTCGVDSVFAKTPTGQEVRIMATRIYSDGKPRRSGFDLLTPNANRNATERSDGRG